MNRTFTFFLSVAILVMASCQTTDNRPQVQGKDVKSAAVDSATYLDGISSMPTVSEAEALKEADRPITKGRVAYMTYQACGFKGGLTLLLTGPSQRYCLKELQYKGLMSHGVTYNTVTGMEYLAILGRIDEFRQTGDVAGASAREGGQE
jgi:hypothetical protein